MMPVVRFAAAEAQAWPSKPVRIIMETGPGSVSDTACRALKTPAGVPDAIIQRLNAEVVKALADPRSWRRSPTASSRAGMLVRKYNVAKQ
jgi:tripartite-type tricarboxylate transporter receptor subunit TctC